MRKITTGVHGLDSQLEGGFPVGSTIALLSPPSNAAQMFTVQFAAGGLMTASDVVYVNTDRALEDVKAQMGRLDVRVQDISSEAQLIPVDVFQDRLDAVGSGHGMSRDLPRRVKNIVAKERDGDHRIVVDSASFLIDRWEWEKVRDFLEYVTLSMRRGDGVMLLSVTKGLHDAKTETFVKQLADGFIELGMHTDGMQATPFLKVGKMRGTHLSNRVLPYEETENGLWLETAARVF